MRRKIELYIGERRADLQEDGLVLMNYALTEMEKPTAVKNSFSKQITLPGTPANDAIFGFSSRLDRISPEDGFKPLIRTPFALYADTGEILESGYLRLDKVNRAGDAHTYTITLYGGLGNFFYGLMYQEDGDKKTLADITYYHNTYTSGGEIEGLKMVTLERTLNASMINTSWLRIDDYKPTSAIRAGYRVLNWMPCYNGLPPEFDSSKALVYPSSIGGGIPNTLTDDDGNVVQPYQGWGLLEMAKDMNEWKMRDLRSYLQRPILNVQSFLDSLSLPENNGGYTLEWKTRPPREEDLWLTLKRPVEIEWSGGTQTQEFTNKRGSLSKWPSVQKSEVEYSLDVKGLVTLDINIRPELYLAGTQPSGGILYESWDRYKSDGVNQETAACATFIQVVLYDASGNVKNQSPVYLFTNGTSRKAFATLAEELWAEVRDEYSYYRDDLTPVGGWEVGYIPVNGYYTRQGSSYYYNWNNLVTISLQAERVAKMKIIIGRMADEFQHGSGSDYYRWVGWNTTSGLASDTKGKECFYRSYINGTAEIVSSAPRSGVTLAPEDLLQSNYSPGEYLLSLGKMYGWLFTCDEAAKKVTIWSRNAFYAGNDTIDLSARIDRGKDIVITPLYAGSRIYSFAPEAIGGKAEEYTDKYGRTYGAFRVITGYEFNDAEINLSDGVIFKVPIWWTDRGRDYTWPYVGDTWHFNFEQDGYKLTYGGRGDSAFTKEFPPVFPTTWNSFGLNIAFADIVGRAQFQDEDGAAVAGEDCLVYMIPRADWETRTDMYQLTDDNDMMYYLNGDKPCWLCAWDTSVDGVYAILNAGSVPNFLPFMRDTANDIDNADWLYYGIPAELYDPHIASWNEDETLYYKYWRAYLSDLLNQDTKVMKCRVDFSGIQVGPELLRRFYYYGGSLWVLNKITNYSLTTWDPVECEFIQVQDKANYTNGQIL